MDGKQASGVLELRTERKYQQRVPEDDSIHFSYLRVATSTWYSSSLQLQLLVRVVRTGMYITAAFRIL